MTINFLKRSRGLKSLLGDSRGIAHVVVPVLILAVLVGSVGAYFVTRSHADTVTGTYVVSGPVPQYDCKLLGRVWSTTYGKCTNTCASTVNGNRLITNLAYNYCKGNISFITRSKCDSLHRAWSIYVGGCGRRNEQTTYTHKNPSPVQCNYMYARYVVTSTYDKCDTYYVPSGK